MLLPSGVLALGLRGVPQVFSGAGGGEGCVFSQEVSTVSLEVLFLTKKTSKPFSSKPPLPQAAMGTACGHGGPAKEP